jgi:hypothetical protein
MVQHILHSKGVSVNNWGPGISLAHALKPAEPPAQRVQRQARSPGPEVVTRGEPLLASAHRRGRRTLPPARCRPRAHASRFGLTHASVGNVPHDRRHRHHCCRLCRNGRWCCPGPPPPPPAPCAVCFATGFFVKRTPPVLPLLSPSRCFSSSEPPPSTCSCSRSKHGSNTPARAPSKGQYAASVRRWANCEYWQSRFLIKIHYNLY